MRTARSWASWECSECTELISHITHQAVKYLLTLRNFTLVDRGGRSGAKEGVDEQSGEAIAEHGVQRVFQEGCARKERLNSVRQTG